MAGHLRLSFALSAVGLLLVSSAGAAGPIRGTVVDEDGKGIEAVVWVDSPKAEKSRASEPIVIRQHDKAFVPRVAVVEVGQLVRFPNDDQVFHNVFSASKPNDFDLGLFKADGKYDEATKTKIEKGPAAGEVRFRQAGRVDVFCNVHPEMTAALVVVAHPYHARTDSGGAFTIKAPALPAGTAIRALDENGNEAQAALAPGQPLKLVFKDRKTKGPEHKKKDGSSYPVDFGTPY